ncbi:hypothetical protein SAMN00768000_2886 [Sulfobacillus thermosulfidooxidans DSM 9293]|uniref:Uncharacterized protein n=1 Tax=Sulfobacillus thermosulfidooxidans (strain DSM 9293 / VKM B-1269 / AT-1) TaxID=929705 RepID=A0A1W1WLG1_SULTA|nr:hypothetical protein [Sulfobacillus thermosulfidooxidans]SMC06563.1 hypothetical protein SAMN00768000_2886 [Sulfobacillus thermosulfidooxidans DSM 9293]
MTWLKGMLVGGGAVLVLEMLWLSLVGISIVVPSSTVSAVVAETMSQFKRQDLTANLEEQITPLLNRSMIRLVHTVNIQVDGIPLGINPNNEERLQQQLMHDMNTSMMNYLQRQMDSGQLTQNITRFVLTHPQKLDVTASLGPVSIPVQVTIP